MNRQHLVQAAGGRVKKRVTIIQARLHHFRVPFYQALKANLSACDIGLTLIHGDASPHERGKMDEGNLDWSVKVKNRSVYIGSIELLWQPCLKHLRQCDLLVVQQENRVLLNYLLLARRHLTRQTLAFWGHGVNCQASNPHGLGERWKRLFLKAPDWWFAYTDFTQDILIAAGYPQEKITVVQNAVETDELRSHLESISRDELESERQRLGIRGGLVTVFCGSLYENKRIGFLLDASKKIREKLTDFELVIIGAGPEVTMVRDAAVKHSWIHYVGPRFGREKALFLKLANVFLMPGGVGLAILDSFAAGLPLITTDCRLHGPEIAYLRRGENGFMTADCIDEYVAAVVHILRDRSLLSVTSQNALLHAQKYSIEGMARNFAEGVVKALAVESA